MSAPSSEAKPNRRRSSVLSEEQQEFLAKAIQNRPSKEELLKKNVLVEDSGSFNDNRQNVAKQMANRSAYEQLESHHIAQPRNVAPKLQAAAKSLERSMVADQLSQKLYDKADIETLREHNIMRAENVAPRLRDAKLRLEYQFTKDHVGHLLDKRSDASELVSHRILLDNNVAPRLQGPQRQLQYNMTADRLNSLIQKRPDAAELQQQGILHAGPNVAPALQARQRELEQNMTRSTLFHALKHRPSLVELEQRGVHPNASPDDNVSTEQKEAQAAPAQQAQPQAAAPAGRAQAGIDNGEPQSAYQRRSKNFHLTRILLKFVASMAEHGEISLWQKGYLKDLIVDQDTTILAVAETFDADNDLNDFKDSLTRLATRR